MSSRKDHLTQKLITVVENGIFEAVKPLVDAGADMNGLTHKVMDTPIYKVLNKLYLWIKYPQRYPDMLDDNKKADYMLTLLELFECGANDKCLEFIDGSMLVDLIYDVWGMKEVVLILQYGVKIRRLCLGTRRLLVHRIINYYDDRCEINTSSCFYSAISTGLFKDFLMLEYRSEDLMGTFEKKSFLRFAQIEKNIVVVEFSFSIDFVIGLFC